MRWSKVMKSDSEEDNGIQPYPPPEVEGSASGGQQIGDRLSLIERQAYEKGFSAGEQAGRELGVKQTDRMQGLLENLIEEIKAYKEEVVRSSEQEIVKISTAMARRILRQEIQQRPEVIVGYLQEALRHFWESEAVQIRIHPMDLEVLRRERGRLIQAVEGIKWLRLEEDAHLHPGECIVSSRDRTVDGRIDSQLSVIREALIHPEQKQTG